MLAGSYGKVENCWDNIYAFDCRGLTILRLPSLSNC